MAIYASIRRLENLYYEPTPWFISMLVVMCVTLEIPILNGLSVTPLRTLLTALYLPNTQLALYKPTLSEVFL